MKPSITKPLAEVFDATVRKMVSKLIDPTGTELISEKLLHDRLGAGVPAYAKHVEAIYNAAKQESLHGIETVVELVLQPPRDDIGPERLIDDEQQDDDPGREEQFADYLACARPTTP